MHVVAPGTHQPKIHFTIRFGDSDKGSHQLIFVVPGQTYVFKKNFIKQLHACMYDSRAHLVGTCATELACSSMSFMFSLFRVVNGRSIPVSSLGQKPDEPIQLKESYMLIEFLINSSQIFVGLQLLLSCMHACMKTLFLMKGPALIVHAESIFLPRM